MQATVSDYPYLRSVGEGDTIKLHNPALASAYDYYPFGMLMPDRYVSDTTSKCITISQPQWISSWTNNIYSAASWVWPGYTPMTGGGTTPASSASVSGGTVNLALSNGTTAPAMLDFHFSVAPVTPQQIVLDVASTMPQIGISVMQQVNGQWVNLAATTAQAGLNTLTFTPVAAQVKLRFYRMDAAYTSKTMSIKTVNLQKRLLSQQTVLVDVCDEVNDKYRFGFNGQEKVNEWAGIGNFMDYKERGQDARIGRFLSIDPIASRYPFYSPYQFAGNTPIMAIDIDGLEPFVMVKNAYRHTDGSVTIVADVHIKAKVINMSNDKVIDMNSVAANLQSDLITALDGEASSFFSMPFEFKGKPGKRSPENSPQSVARNVRYKVNVTADVKMVASKNDLTKDDWVLAIVNSVDDTKEMSIAGLANQGGKVALAEANEFGNGNHPKGKALALHEFLHLLGAEDIYNTGRDDKSNVMSNSRGMKFTSEQRAKEVWGWRIGPWQRVWKALEKKNYSQPKGMYENEDTRKQLMFSAPNILVNAILIGCLLINIGCQNNIEKESKAVKKRSSYDIGYKIVRANCAGCHSFGTDTAYAKITMHDFYENDSVKLVGSLYQIMNDSIHKERTPMVDSADVESVVIYLKHVFDIRE